MRDEYYERYRRVAHAQLYRELHAGTPARVDALADTWRGVAETLRAVAEQLTADLTDLQTAWSSDGSRRYQDRLGLVVTWAQTLSADAETMRAGLAAMSGALTEALRRADPEPTDAVEWSHDAALASVLGLASTAEQRTQAQERLAQVVAELAITYELADGRTWAVMTNEVPSPDLPGNIGEADDDGGGTQLAGAQPLVSAPAPHLVAPPPAVTLSGTGLAASGTGGQLATASTVGGAPVSSTAAALPPPVMGAAPGAHSSSGSEPVVTGRRSYLDEAPGGEPDWAQADGTENADEPPPSVLGRAAPPE